MSELLPVGSVVKISNNDMAEIMIAGYYMIDRNTNKCYQYAGVIVPAGIPETNNFLLFNNQDIREVVFQGYFTEESKSEINKLKSLFDGN